MDIEEHEIETLIDCANLKGKLMYDVIKFEDQVEIKLFSNVRCICLPRDAAHQALEECAMSTNQEDYFWYLADKYR